MTLDGFDGLSPLQRYVLLAAAGLASRGASPFQSYEVRDLCIDHLDELSAAPFEGGITREAVIRALSALEEAEFVATEYEDRSPVGKGRPNYRLATDPDAVFKQLAEDDLLAPVAAELS